MSLCESEVVFCSHDTAVMSLCRKWSRILQSGCCSNDSNNARVASSPQWSHTSQHQPSARRSSAPELEYLLSSLQRQVIPQHFRTSLKWSVLTVAKVLNNLIASLFRSIHFDLQCPIPHFPALSVANDSSDPPHSKHQTQDQPIRGQYSGHMITLDQSEPSSKRSPAQSETWSSNVSCQSFTF